MKPIQKSNPARDNGGKQEEERPVSGFESVVGHLTGM